jgi:branched-chain amino acid aminotransferase
LKTTPNIWIDGKIVPWADATVHVMTHSLHYGSAMFEGIRAYKTDHGSMIFRLDAHIQRLYRSASIYDIKIPFEKHEVARAIKDLFLSNKIDECYIRPILFYGWDEVGINPKGNKVHLAIAMWPWLPYLGEDGLRKGIRCKISSWARIDSRSLPTMAKAAANYANSILAKTEAQKLGYDEAILLNTSGMVTEGTGENLFVVRDQVLCTPPLSAGILPGITRDSVLRLGRDLGYRVKERNISRGELLISDEVFLTGTAAEVTPVKEIDADQIGNGSIGPVTEKIQSKYLNLVRGRDPAYASWLEPVK